MNLSTLLSLGGGQKPRKMYSNYVPGSYVVTIPSDVWFVIATIQAGGGGGGKSRYAPTDSMGAACGELWLEKPIFVTPGSTMPLVVGSGGTPGAATVSLSSNGYKGGDSSFGGLLALGGLGSLGVSESNFSWTALGLTEPGTVAALEALAMQGLVDGIIDRRYGLKRRQLEMIDPCFIPPFFPPIGWDTANGGRTQGVQLTNIGHRTPPSFSNGVSTNFSLGGGRSWWANGTPGRYTTQSTVVTPGFGAGGGSYNNNNTNYSPMQGDPGGPGFVELVYFSDYVIA